MSLWAGTDAMRLTGGEALEVWGLTEVCTCVPSSLACSQGPLPTVVLFDSGRNHRGAT